ncbi:ScbR family autoregulator-binding transcription factor [Couchioplanes azureus]|uniref:ScbR family autoregulator-binding transcription factor n=1 Tax=Couchioplanes caeruleus TaxID=56438 RepID=UPI0016710D1C|nr:ScbR family autoregulator-binding transcription factor [Couchioplanes caeruleus]GGQ76126.1 TetR family transcriptional regulator [Couchioplanes caeruleus subsp. azureus]
MQNRAQQTRTRLVRAAADSFDRYGYTGTNMAGVARSAGVTKGALYFHFATKIDLVRALNEESRLLLRGYAAAIELRRPSPLQAVVDLSHGLAGALRTEPIIRATLRVARECGNCGEPFLDFYLQWAQAVTDLLRGSTQDCLAPAVEPDALAALLLALHIGADAMVSAAEPRLGAAWDLAGAWRMILPGVAADGVLGHLEAAGSAPAGA